MRTNRHRDGIRTYSFDIISIISFLHRYQRHLRRLGISMIFIMKGWGGGVLSEEYDLFHLCDIPGIYPM